MSKMERKSPDSGSLPEVEDFFIRRTILLQSDFYPLFATQTFRLAAHHCHLRFLQPTDSENNSNFNKGLISSEKIYERLDIIEGKKFISLELIRPEVFKQIFQPDHLLLL